MNTTTDRMSGDEAALWTQLRTFVIDGPDTQLTFVARLARENGWHTAYTQRVMEEYRKFLFLCCVSPSGVTPSDAVDQAWHLHLTYTKSYWIDLCRNTIRQEIHHTPTKGGKGEAQKFDGLYSHSQTLYARYFGIFPPTDIWPDHQHRFADIDFVRINRRTNWVIRKPGWVRSSPLLLAGCAIAVAGLFFQAAGGALLTALIGFSLFAFWVYGMSNSAFPSSRRRDDSGGGDGGGCGSVDMGDGHHGADSSHSGDSSGDFGCSSGGCSSGCGGGCGGGD